MRFRHRWCSRAYNSNLFAIWYARITFLIFKYGLLLSCLKFTERVYCLCDRIAVNNVQIMYSLVPRASPRQKIRENATHLWGICISQPLPEHKPRNVNLLWYMRCNVACNVLCNAIHRYNPLAQQQCYD